MESVLTVTLLGDISGSHSGVAQTSRRLGFCACKCKCKGKGTGKVDPITGHEGPEVE